MLRALEVVFCQFNTFLLELTRLRVLYAMVSFGFREFRECPFYVYEQPLSITKL